GGITPEGRFQLGPSARLPDDLPVERLQLRRSLLAQFDRARAGVELQEHRQAFDKFQKMAFTLVTSSRMRDAMDVGRESLALRDLEARGLLDETLVLWLSEHGRTPRIDSKPKGAGRHHWSRAYSVALAGGGAARGKVVGATDRLGGDVRDTPVSPKDLLATAFHQLGIDADTTVPDLQGRPMPIAGSGRVREEVLA